MATVICITNQKGGVGKTTTAVNLGYFLAKDKYKTLIVDFDPQGNATSGLGVTKKQLKNTMTEVLTQRASLADTLVETKTKNLWIAPTTPELANAEVEIANVKGKFGLLRQAISSLADKFDYVIIDSPPSLSLLTVNGMIAADYLLLPVQTEFYALEGVAQLLTSMKQVMKQVMPWLMKMATHPVLLITPVSLRRAWLIRRACRPTKESPISPSISAFGTSAATESITTTSSAPLRTRASVISSACSPVSGWET